LSLGLAYTLGLGVKRNYTKATEWLRKSAEQGDASAQMSLGTMYTNGQGVAQDYTQAVEWYRKAAEQGNAYAQYSLGVAYDMGQGVAQDSAKAVEWYRKSAEQGNADAQWSLGVAYDVGSGVPKNHTKAVEWYRKSAEQGNAGGQVALGEMYDTGDGVPKDYAKAVEWERKSAEQGGAAAQGDLGAMYENGQGVAQDYVEAYKWFVLAAAQGLPDAKKEMDTLSQQMTPDQIAEAQTLASQWKPRGRVMVSSSATAFTNSQAMTKDEISQIVAQALKEETSTKAAVPTVHSDVDAPDYHLKPRPDDFAVVVGVKDYANALPEADFAVRDAQAVRRHLEALGFLASHVQFLSGPQATESALQARVEDWLPKNVKPDSTVFFYFAGHGAADPVTGDAYLVPFDGDPEYLKDTAYPLSRLYSRLSELQARRVIVALDSCFSGAGGRSVVAQGTRPLVTKIKEGFIPADGKLTVFTASKKDQISGVMESQGHGTFTYYFLEGLNGAAMNASGHVTAESLYRYLAPEVADAAHLDNRDQTPQIFPVNLTQDSQITLR